jgi:molybdopterin-synthase adenylyltransferase
VAGEPAVEYRLKRSIDAFPASDGELYLLRTGSGEDHVVKDPTERDRAILELLGKGYVTEAGIVDELRRRGVDDDGVGDALADLEQGAFVERAGGGALLSERERDRYDRQLIYFADLAAPGVLAEELQQRLREATVVVLGTGGLGSWTACGLACAGVGSLVLVDDDRVELSNLNRQILFGERDVGGLKVERAKRALRAHNPEIAVRAVERRVRGPRDLDDLVDGASLVITVADWPPYDLPRWVNRACVEAGVPHVSAGQRLPLNRVGPTVVPGESACLECEERGIRRDYPLYDELAEFRTAHPVDAATIAPASGIVGSMLAMEAIHLLTGLARPSSQGAVLLFDLRTLVVKREEIARDPDCPLCGGLAHATDAHELAQSLDGFAKSAR